LDRTKNPEATRERGDDTMEAIRDQIVRSSPTIIGAIAVLLIGWIVARVVSGIVRAVLHRTGTGERLVQWITGEAALKPVDAELWIGKMVYYLIMLFVLVGFFQVVGLTIVTEPLVRMMNQIFQTIPALLGAGLFLLLAWVTASVLRFIVIRLLKATKTDESLRSVGALKNMQAAPSEIAGHLVRVAIMLFAAIEAARILGFVLLADLLVRFTVSAGHVLTGLVIFAVGLYIANLISNMVLASGMTQASLLAVAARVSILVLVGAMALRQMDLANEIINMAFTLLLGAIAATVALAFGLGGRDVAARELEGWVQSAKSRKI
jgi:hypothetical protein